MEPPPDAACSYCSTLECTYPSVAAWFVRLASWGEYPAGDWAPICDPCKRHLQENYKKMPREYRLAEPDVQFYFSTYFEEVLPQCIRDKLAYYLLENKHYTRPIQAHVPIKTLAVIQWLSPGYYRNNDTAKRTRMVTQAIVVNPTEEEANKEIRLFMNMDRERQEREKKARLGWCSCCGYGDCKRAATVIPGPGPISGFYYIGE